MRYQFTVTLTRESTDDIPIANAAGLEGAINNVLLQQLRRELQQAYDEGTMAGEFEIHEDSFKTLGD